MWDPTVKLPVPASFVCRRLATHYAAFTLTGEGTAGTFLVFFTPAFDVIWRYWHWQLVGDGGGDGTRRCGTWEVAMESTVPIIPDPILITLYIYLYSTAHPHTQV